MASATRRARAERAPGPRAPGAPPRRRRRSAAPDGDADQAGATTRRSPGQARSRERVDLLLDATAELLRAHGYAALTTNRIAARAGVPVGSLYQYFARKEDLVRALALRSLARVDALLDELLAGSGEQPWEALADRILEALARIYATEPGLRAVWLGPNVPGELAAADREHDRALARRLDPLLARAAPGLAPARRGLVADVLVQVTGSLLTLLVRRPARERARVLAEAKRLVRGYLRALISEAP